MAAIAVILTIPDKGKDRLNALRVKIGADHSEDIVKEALRLYEYCVNHYIAFLEEGKSETLKLTDLFKTEDAGL